jgi:hypothetical protein
MGQTVECLLCIEEEIEGQNGFQPTGNENQPREAGHQDEGPLKGDESGLGHESHDRG